MSWYPSTIELFYAKYRSFHCLLIEIKSKSYKLGKNYKLNTCDIKSNFLWWIFWKYFSYQIFWVNNKLHRSKQNACKRSKKSKRHHPSPPVSPKTAILVHELKHPDLSRPDGHPPQNGLKSNSWSTYKSDTHFLSQ